MSLNRKVKQREVKEPKGICRNFLFNIIPIMVFLLGYRCCCENKNDCEKLVVILSFNYFAKN